MRLTAKLPYTFVHVILVLFSLCMLLPILMIVNIALKTNTEFLNSPLSIASSLNFDNFAEAWKQGDMVTNFKNSLLYTGFSTVLTCLVAALAAYPISRKHIRGTGFLLGLIGITLFLPDGIVPMLFFMKYTALLNTYTGYILLSSGINMALMVFILVGFVKNIPAELDEAAALDGCGYFRYILTIIMPLLKPALTTVAMLKIINVWNDFINPYLYLTDKEKRPLTSGLYLFVGEFSTDWTVLAAGIVIVVTPLVLVYLFLQKYIISGVSSGALKG
ncbi:carbohydrate ABC transporter permease [Cohnella lupini]|uniref:Carbohydrate ABC transporter membrane protein 2 (CUT1 family) n=1 Tax=Cohnella lupini TaxID=1294267 RepID=A0A3D9I2U9_9BACL|nr:carbohydrate ABC transporter permease [Cohnella lupini]RED55486.1 carbohydrate ABC transporter membrane protein 2 (CUT1 family) [Cohnella lupini]